jgi:hypothetical protein
MSWVSTCRTPTVTSMSTQSANTSDLFRGGPTTDTSTQAGRLGESLVSHQAGGVIRLYVYKDIAASRMVADYYQYWLRASPKLSPRRFVMDSAATCIEP